MSIPIFSLLVNSVQLRIKKDASHETAGAKPNRFREISVLALLAEETR
jgi:hypothetical protein